MCRVVSKKKSAGEFGERHKRQKMGNRLSSCGPLIRKAYRHEDTPWQNSRKRDGHLLRYCSPPFRLLFLFPVSSRSGNDKQGPERNAGYETNFSGTIDSSLCAIHFLQDGDEPVMQVRKCVAGWLGLCVLFALASLLFFFSFLLCLATKWNRRFPPFQPKGNRST